MWDGRDILAPFTATLAFLRVHSLTLFLAELRLAKAVLPDDIAFTRTIFLLGIAYSRVNPKGDIVGKLTQMDTDLTTRCKNFIVKFCEGF
jgi:hypothetical protein